MRKFSISLPSPCHENWSTFQPAADGGFCSKCNSNVTDFTSMTDHQVIRHLEAHPTGCGRFRSEQLKAIQAADTKVSKLISAPILALTLVAIPPTAEAAPGIERQQVVSSVKFPEIQPDTLITITVTGRVVDELGVAIPGTTIALKRMGLTTYADVDGKFTLHVRNAKSTDQLTVSFIGFLTESIALAPEVTVIMKEDVEALSEKVIMGGYCASRRGWWRKITSIFRRRNC